MKYIRTKDGIYENKPLEKHLGKRRGKGFEIVFKEQDIIKQADTIEELCDVIVCNELVYGNLYSACKYQQWHKELPIYGCIWTNKGLIYVAKMNDEGKLELL